MLKYWLIDIAACIVVAIISTALVSRVMQPDMSTIRIILAGTYLGTLAGIFVRYQGGRIIARK